jgi:Holliday junction DNA helicase RuvA
MFESIEGTVRSRTPSAVVLDVHGVSFRLQIPLSTYERVPAQGTARLQTRLYIQEDQVRLFGFATAEERQLFEDLIQSASRVGPVKALAILSSAGVREILAAIARGDVAFLKRIRGIGEKIAQRLVVELKDRVTASLAGGAASAAPPASGAVEEAVQALVSLGYGEREATEAARAAAAKTGPDAPPEAILRRALQSR